MQNGKPWDARLAFRLVYPLKDSFLTPNHFTVLRLATGVTAFIMFSHGSYLWINMGAMCFAISNFLDHTDGELARISGKMSRSGHYFDLASDALVNILLFIGIGIGLSKGVLGTIAIPVGATAGLSVAAIFHMRMFIENRIGKDSARQPHMGGMEAEDILYLLPLVTLTNQLVPFLILAGIGAPLFALWVLKEYLALNKKES